VVPPAFDGTKRTDGFAGKSDGVVGSWVTPIVIKTGQREELIMTWPETIIAYDPPTGRELWRSGGLNPLLYTSPMFGEGIVVGMSGYGGSSVAVRAGGDGDVHGEPSRLAPAAGQAAHRLRRDHRRPPLHPQSAWHRPVH
jgi:hypothetical protein